jgi:recombinational DNA repair protein RecR
VAEAPINAMSVAAIEHLRADTLYTATAGGMGPATIDALEQQLRTLAAAEGGEIAIATDNDSAGHGYADRLTDMARVFDLKVSRLLPSGGANDWNDVLRQGREACYARQQGCEYILLDCDALPMEDSTRSR